jgi:hypothetical protein
MITKEQALGFLQNTFIDFTLINGETVKLTLAFALLKELESRNPDLASRYFKVTSKDQKAMTEMDVLTIVYAAYVCANLSNPEMLDEEVFTILLGHDRFAIRGVMNRLTSGKKKPGSVTHS